VATSTAAPFVYYLAGGDNRAQRRSLTVLFPFFGVKLIADAKPAVGG
jgi:hypothetical protein